MLVYKYMPAERFFGNYKLRLTPAEDLNDLSELAPDIRLRNPMAYANGIVTRNLASTYLQALILNPELDPLIVWCQILAAANAHISNFDEQATASDIYDKFMRVTNRNVGVLSLTDSSLNEKMWAHYASDHAGFAVALDSQSDFFQPKPGEPKPCGELMNVIYTETVPVVYVDAGKLDIPKEVFFAKSTKWSDESEWRMIKYLPMADEIKIGDGGKKIHLFEVPREAIKEVIFGANVKNDVIERLQLDIRKQVPHVVFKKIRFTRPRGITAENL
jgi:Protein of unknown function (DUF2971)